MSLSPTYQTVILLLLVLVTTLIYLLGYTLWTRAKKRYWSRYKVKFRTMFIPLILDYIETAERQSDADDVVKKLTHRNEDLTLFLELLDETTDILNGDDRQKLNWLIKHPLFDRFYRKKLYSRSKNSQLLACVYYTKSGYLNRKMSLRLIKLVRSPNIKVAYASAKVLQNSSNEYIRLNTLTTFFERSDASSMMVGELIHLFHYNSNEMYELSGNALKKLLIRKDISKERKQIVVNYIAHQNLFVYSTFLYQYLQKLLYRPENKVLIQSIIIALGKLRVEEAGPLIRSYTVVEDAGLRISCVDALNQLGGEDNLSFITNMLLDIEFDVRKQIIQRLVQDADQGHMLLEKFMLLHLKFISKIWSSELPTNEMLIFISKLRSITTGIRILSANSSLHIKSNY